LPVETSVAVSDPTLMSDPPILLGALTPVALPEPVGADEPLGAGASVVAVGGAVDASEAAADGGPGAPAATVRLLPPPSP
jgi:hypothetical protein